MRLLFYLTLVVGHFQLLFQLGTCQVPHVSEYCRYLLTLLKEGAVEF